MEVEDLTGSLLLRSLGLQEEGPARYSLPGAVAGVSRAAVAVHDPDGLWPLLQAGFFSRIGKVSFQWGGRTFRKLQVEVCEKNDVKWHVTSALHGYKIPYLHMYFVKCESLENYKAVVNPRLKAWVEEMKSGANGLDKCEWVIVYVPVVAHRDSEAKMQATGHKKIFDRIKADFNPSKTERCFKITLYQDTPSDEQQGPAGDGEWGELLKRVYTSIISAFEVRCRRLEDQVLKLEEQADVPGWNYCTYLVLKESLAFTWLQLGQYYDALRIFDSLTLQLDKITQSGEIQQSTNKLPLNLFNARKLAVQDRQRILTWAENGVLSTPQPKPQPQQGSEVNEQQDTSTPILAQSKKIVGRLSRKLSWSLSFGTKGNVEKQLPRFRAESLLQRATIQPQQQQPKRTSSLLHLKPHLEPTSASPALSVSKTLSPVSSKSSQPSAPNSPRPPRPPPTVVPAVLLDVKRKAFRDEIYKSAVSMLEMRLYLFVRSTLVLFTVGRQDEALRRALHSISSFCNEIMQDGISEASDETTQDDGKLSNVQPALIALSWAFCSCLEIVCAAHAASAAHPVEGISEETLLYQAELVAYASMCFEGMLRLVYPQKDRQAEFNLKNCRFAKLSTLPSILRGLHHECPDVAEQCILLSGPSKDVMETWLPSGLMDALCEPSEAIAFRNLLLECEAEYLFSAGRKRKSFSLQFLRAHLYIGDRRWHRALEVLNLIQPVKPFLASSSRSTGMGPLRPFKQFPVLDSEVMLLVARAQIETKDFEGGIVTCLKILRLADIRREQRIEALRYLRTCLPKVSALRLSAKRFPLFHMCILETSSPSSTTTTPPSTVAQLDTKTPTQHRQGESIQLDIQLNSSLPEELELERCVVRFKRVTQKSLLRFSTSASVTNRLPRFSTNMSTSTQTMQGRKGANSNAISEDRAYKLVRFRSTDNMEDSDLFQEQDFSESEGFNGEMDVDDDDYISSEGLSLGDDSNPEGEADEEEEDEEDDEDEDEEEGNDDMLNRTAEDKGEDSLMKQPTEKKSPEVDNHGQVDQQESDNDTDVPEVSETREITSPLTIGPDDISDGNGNNSPSSRVLPQKHHSILGKSKKYIFFRVEKVLVKPGEQQVTLFASPLAGDGTMYELGMYRLDRMMFQLNEEVELVFPVDPSPRGVVGADDTMLEICPLPLLFTADFKHASGGFVPVDESPGGKVPLDIVVKAAGSAVLSSKIQQLRMGVDFGEDDTDVEGDMDRTVRLKRIVGPDENGVFLFDGKSKSIPSVESGEELCVFVQTEHLDRCVGVDKLHVANEVETEILQPSGLSRSSSSSAYTASVKFDMMITMENSAVLNNGEVAQVVVRQTRSLRLRVGAPFEVSQCTRLVGDTVWTLLTLKSNLPETTRVFDVTLQGSASISNSKEFIVSRSQNLQLAFSSPLDKSAGFQDVVRDFTAKYSVVGQSYEGMLTKQVAFRQGFVSQSLAIQTQCVNVDSVRVGSTAVFLFSLRKVDDKVWLVEPIFAQPSAKLINISSSPLFSRGNRSKGFSRAGSFDLKETQTSSSLQDDKEDAVVESPTTSPNKSLKVVYEILFDQSQWMVVGVERGHLTIDGPDCSVACEFVPLKAGLLPAPVLHPVNVPLSFGAQSPSRFFLQVV